MYEFDSNPPEGITIYAPAMLAEMPTIHSGQWDNLKVETPTLRYWVPRVGPEDGEDWEVHVERLEDGCWRPLVKYRSGSAE